MPVARVDWGPARAVVAKGRQILRICADGRSIAFLYYMGLVTLIGLARQRTLPVGVAMWLPNVILLGSGCSWWSAWSGPAIGTSSVAFRERDGRTWLRFAETCLRHRRRLDRRLPIGPQIIDHYVLTSFLFYFVPATGKLRADDARLHVLRTAQRHPEEQHPDVAGGQVSFLSDAEAGVSIRRRSACWWRCWLPSAFSRRTTKSPQ